MSYCEGGYVCRYCPMSDPDNIFRTEKERDEHEKTCENKTDEIIKNEQDKNLENLELSEEFKSRDCSGRKIINDNYPDRVHRVARFIHMWFNNYGRDRGWIKGKDEPVPFDDTPVEFQLSLLDTAQNLIEMWELLR